MRPSEFVDYIYELLPKEISPATGSRLFSNRREDGCLVSGFKYSNDGEYRDERFSYQKGLLNVDFGLKRRFQVPDQVFNSDDLGGLKIIDHGILCEFSMGCKSDSNRWVSSAYVAGNLRDLKTQTYVFDPKDLHRSLRIEEGTNLLEGIGRIIKHYQKSQKP